MYKRAFDILVALALAPFALAICSIACLVYVLVEKENPIFLQDRVGRYEKIFSIVKLRSMKSSTENVATHIVSHSAVTRVGFVLRRTKIDELPQLWNVLRGEMSLVGPRPGLPVQKELVLERRKYNLYSIRPGITGISQVKKIDMSDPVRIAQSDSEYLQNASVNTDIRLLLNTVFGQG